MLIFVDRAVLVTQAQIEDMAFANIPQVARTKKFTGSQVHGTVLSG